MYLPDPIRHAPASVGLPEAAEVVLDTRTVSGSSSGTCRRAADKPVVIYFHGNGAA